MPPEAGRRQNRRVTIVVIARPRRSRPTICRRARAHEPDNPRSAGDPHPAAPPPHAARHPWSATPQTAARLRKTGAATAATRPRATTGTGAWTATLPPCPAASLAGRPVDRGPAPAVAVKVSQPAGGRRQGPRTNPTFTCVERRPARPRLDQLRPHVRLHLFGRGHAQRPRQHAASIASRTLRITHFTFSRLVAFIDSMSIAHRHQQHGAARRCRPFHRRC